MKRMIKEWMQIVFGLLVFALGVHLTIRADLGLAPWDCLGTGISLHTPLNYGLSMTAMGVVILLIDLLLKETIGFGTIIDALLTGNFVQMFRTLDPFPATPNLPAGLALIVAGLTFMALGQFFYMRAAQCCGPRDALLVGLGKRFPRLPIGVVQVALWAIVLLCGRLLGGPVGIGTLASTFGSGVITQAVFSLLRFEPRAVRHRDVITAVREIKQKAKEGV